MKDNFSYPIEEFWSVDELTQVIDFYSKIEKAYDGGVSVKILSASYDNFKKVVPNKSEQKRLFREFEKNSGLASFPIVKQLRDPKTKVIRG
ncbi:UPF0223 family protein [Pediococcus argentinicus]|uniref:Uncharacterized protein n=1 Tax=Pediococcus argentinicus TaxID=480391 RepID=A0A0R2NII8_9LACO|nr:UPF0223 family protein [Pediococcus argentinicus]KRO25592.1 hypothetical protein IV88_GL001672 [Pediococcus argentinicus]NKZ22118.1 UPF0223 family protein [Pediococcus argentinicus]GEP19588.1 hypothetical protein LSA03_09720 [Pediococcus argentinicus]